MKASRAEVAKRVKVVLDLRLGGAGRHEIRQYSATMGWGLKPRQVDEYIHRADVMLVEEQKTNRKMVFALHLARREYLYAKAVDAGKLQTALNILDSDAKLRGLYPNKDSKKLMMMVKDLSRKIDELSDRLRAYLQHQPSPPEMPQPAPEPIHLQYPEPVELVDQDAHTPGLPVPTLAG